jgi:capsule biosynthesis phosphatase
VGYVNLIKSNMKKLIVDIDNTLCKTENGDYKNSIVVNEVLLKLIEYKKLGFEIILFTSRNMRTYQNNLGKINLNTIPILAGWIKKNKIPCDELYIGKPWCGTEGFYIDDKSIRPDEFISKSYSEIKKIID